MATGDILRWVRIFNWCSDWSLRYPPTLHSGDLNALGVTCAADFVEFDNEYESMCVTSVAGVW